MDLGQVVYEVVGVAAQCFVRGVDAVAVLAETGTPVPVDPRGGQLEDPLDAGGDKIGGIVLNGGGDAPTVEG